MTRKDQSNMPEVYKEGFEDGRKVGAEEARNKAYKDIRTWEGWRLVTGKVGMIKIDRHDLNLMLKKILLIP